MSTTTPELILRAEENSKWLGHNYVMLTKKYNNKWVAVLDRKVFDSDKDLKTLVHRLKKKLGRRYSEVSIEFVTKQPINMVLVIL